jgi:hypothetical protein
MQATGTLAIRMLKQSSGIIKFYHEKNIKTGHKNKENANLPWPASPKADVDRLYVPREEGSRGLMHTEEVYIAEVMNCYM